MKLDEILKAFVPAIIFALILLGVIVVLQFDRMDALTNKVNALQTQIDFMIE